MHCLIMDGELVSDLVNSNSSQRFIYKKLYFLTTVFHLDRTECIVSSHNEDGITWSLHRVDFFSTVEGYATFVSSSYIHTYTKFAQ